MNHQREAPDPHFCLLTISGQSKRLADLRRPTVVRRRLGGIGVPISFEYGQPARPGFGRSLL